LSEVNLDQNDRFTRSRWLFGDDFKKLIKRGLNLLENDYLGGSGSRGYGRVEFSNKDEWVEK